MAEKFLNLIKIIHPQIQEAQPTPPKHKKQEKKLHQYHNQTAQKQK